jgi:penicillin-binding protein 1A
VSISWVGNNNQNIGFKTTRLGQGANTALPIFGKLYQDMTKDQYFNAITRARFTQLTEQQREELNCDDQKRDGFFKRLFSKEEEEKEFERKNKEKEEKKGFFNRLFGKKEN